MDAAQAAQHAQAWQDSSKDDGGAEARPPALLQAQEVCKFYGAREVLHRVSLEIFPREIVTLIGPNGAGKTTLLKLLLGLEPPTHGRVSRQEGLRIGYVPQHFRPQPSLPLRGWDFLALYAPRGVRVREDDRLATLAAQLDVAAVLSQELSSLSGGELRRILLLRALLKSPPLLVLDEPTQGVDIAGQAELYRLLQQLSQREGFAVLMVSHDLYVVMAATHRVLCLNRHLCCAGTPLHVGASPEFRALFGEDLARQLAMYPHHHDHTHSVHEPHFSHRSTP